MRMSLIAVFTNDLSLFKNKVSVSQKLESNERKGCYFWTQQPKLPRNDQNIIDTQK